MKLSPKIYAKLLLEVALRGHPELVSGSHHAGTDIKKIAANFWHLLQKNKQHKDLRRILEALEVESAKAESKTIAKVYSEKELSETELKEIQTKLSLRAIPTDREAKQSIIVKNIVKPNTTGIVTKIEDKIIDLSIEDKINQLRKAL